MFKSKAKPHKYAVPRKLNNFELEEEEECITYRIFWGVGKSRTFNTGEAKCSSKRKSIFKYPKSVAKNKNTKVAFVAGFENIPGLN